MGHAAVIIIVMGVAGAGKTTIGTLLADTIASDFLDADSLHAPANIEKMRSGIALEDADRALWLAAVRVRILEAAAQGRDLVVACSALRESYRAYLAADVQVTWVFLTGSEGVIQQRLQERAGHFMGAGMLRSQLETLEPPLGAVTLDISQAPRELVEQVLRVVRPGQEGRPRSP